MEDERNVQITPAAFCDIRMLLPRKHSEVVVIRHASKLRGWRKGDRRVLDLEVASSPDREILELCLNDSFGFQFGVRLAFFENTIAPPDGELWIIGSRREDELLSSQMIDTFRQRKEMIEERLNSGY